MRQSTQKWGDLRYGVAPIYKLWASYMDKTGKIVPL
jgi:hypothetical protein